jgi:membrane-associated protease RseP (regulator of RpoE activity)
MQIAGLLVMSALAAGQQPPSTAPAQGAPIIRIGPGAPILLNRQAAPPQPAASPISPDVVTLSDAEFERFLQELNDPRFRVREEALEHLCRSPAARLPELVEHYHGPLPFEAKRRLRHAIEYVFYREEMKEELGFMGIEPRALNGVKDPATGEPVQAIFIFKVIAGHPAERAGMKVGDIILSFDGLPVGEIFKQKAPERPDQETNNRIVGYQQPEIEAFTHHVKTSPPGKPVRMRVVRAEHSDAEVAGSVGDDPSQFLAGVELGRDREGRLTCGVSHRSRRRRASG